MKNQELNYDRSLLGVDYPGGVFHIDKEIILQCCRAIGESDPIYIDEVAAQNAGHPTILAPPAFCAVFVRGLGRPDVKLKFGRNTFHANESIETRAQVYAGDTLTATTRLKEVYAKTGRSGTMAFVVWVTSFVNQHGHEVATIQESFVSRE